jgi:nitroreductase/dihydropteridine reductase
MMDERGLPHKTMDAYKQVILDLYEHSGQEWQTHHAAKQSYISFAMAIAAAAEQKVDATPIEGFLPEKLDELLNLKGSGYKSTVLLPLGYRESEQDWLVNMKKVRTPKDLFNTEMTLADASDNVGMPTPMNLDSIAQKNRVSHKTRVSNSPLSLLSC